MEETEKRLREEVQELMKQAEAVTFILFFIRGLRLLHQLCTSSAAASRSPPSVHNSGLVLLLALAFYFAPIKATSSQLSARPPLTPRPNTLLE